MTEYIAAIFGLGVLMFFLLEIIANFKDEEPLKTNFMTIFKLVIFGLCLIIGIIMLAIMIQILKLQGTADILYTNIVWLYYIWWSFIGLCLLFLPVYYLYLVPKQWSAISEAKNKREKDDWKRI